ncbi:Uncharacterised protein [Streptococcus pneumoniae]|nr:Uncharacterised protein [Streptococcus pneumoniae]COS47934.1 Uncharacterised protein [Streptococcus pneumoniae]COU17805.1 Uncharacterised protein [Streptococcus pneumoniae]
MLESRHHIDLVHVALYEVVHVILDPFHKFLMRVAFYSQVHTQSYDIDTIENLKLDRVNHETQYILMVLMSQEYPKIE